MEDDRFPHARPPTGWGPIKRLVRAPLFRLAVYYLVVVGVALVLVRSMPAARDALLQPSFPAFQEGASLLGGGRGVAGGAASPGPAVTPGINAPGTPAAGPGSETGPGTALNPAPDVGSGRPTAGVPDPSLHHRVVVAFLVILGGIALALPIAWVYMWSKRLRFDPGLVRTIIILPIAVAGILLVVKNSLATAFSLAGIVAAVRFRNTLKDPQDAVYVFLTIAIGISAGVQALDVALVVSLVFNVVVIAMWKLRLGSPSGDSYSQAGTLAIGDSSLYVARTPVSCRKLRQDALQKTSEGDAVPADGVLLVHFTAFDLARNAVQDTLTEVTRDWRLVDVHPRGPSVKTAEYLVSLAEGITPLDLMGGLDEWSANFDAAEYVPFRYLRHPGDRGQDEGKKGGKE